MVCEWGLIIKFIFFKGIVFSKIVFFKIRVLVK